LEIEICFKPVIVRREKKRKEEEKNLVRKKEETFHLTCLVPPSNTQYGELP